MSPSRTAPRLRFWGNFGTGNWGNECTLEAMLQHARQRVGDANLTCVCPVPSDVERRHGIRGIPLRRELGASGAGRLARYLRRVPREAREWLAVFRAAGGADMVVMTGTGMITDCSEGAWGLPYDMFRWALASRVRGARVVFVSVGVEPIRQPLAKFFLLGALRLADYRSYRDAQSREHLRRAGFAASADDVYPDLAFSLPPPAAAQSARGAGANRRVAVGLYDYRGRGQGSDVAARAYREYLDKLGEFVVWLRAHSYDVRILIGDYTYDAPVLHDLRAWLAERGVAGLDDAPATSVEAVMTQIADVDVVVASRFHNVLLALLLGKPVVSISYNEKNDALMAEMGLEAYCQSVEDFTLATLIAQFTEVDARASSLHPRIAERAARFRERLQAQYDALFGAVSARSSHGVGARTQFGLARE